MRRPCCLFDAGWALLQFVTYASLAIYIVGADRALCEKKADDLIFNSGYLPLRGAVLKQILAEPSMSSRRPHCKGEATPDLQVYQETIC